MSNRGRSQLKRDWLPQVCPSHRSLRTHLTQQPCAQIVVVADAELANQVLGAGEGLNKAMEPALSDKLVSHRPGHPTMFSADTNSPYWRLIRKGAAPAFKVENIKCAADPPSPVFLTGFLWTTLLVLFLMCARKLCPVRVVRDT